MATKIWYYSRNCPFCGQDGELLICKTVAGKFCFRCAECFVAYDDPRHMAFPEAGYSAEGIKMIPPTRQEIEEHGWGEHCVYEIIEPD